LLKARYRAFGKGAPEKIATYAELENKKRRSPCFLYEPELQVPQHGIDEFGGKTSGRGITGCALCRAA